ncbi:MAG TPA: hypothetical protein DDW73_24475 [Rhizobium sp.]|nr:hypothetical protein [Rhizobium sp.]
MGFSQLSLDLLGKSLYGGPIPHVKLGIVRETSGWFRPVASLQRGAVCFMGVKPEKEKRHGIA